MNRPARKLRLARATIRHYKRDLLRAETPERREIVDRRYRHACTLIAVWRLTGEVENPGKLP